MNHKNVALPPNTRKDNKLVKVKMGPRLCWGVRGEEERIEAGWWMSRTGEGCGEHTA